METKKIISITGAILLIFGFLYGAYIMTNKPEVTFFESLTKSNENDHVKWSKNKEILFIKYSDFECPACATYQQLIQSMSEKPENRDIVDKVTFIYRHFPLDQIHKNARSSAQASVAAGNQGKFFEFHDLLFERQAEWASSNNPSQIYEKYATELNLDVSKFNEDSKSQNSKDKVQKDYLSGLEINVQGTPSFYLNGKKISFRSEVELAKILKDEIQNLN